MEPNIPTTIGEILTIMEEAIAYHEAALGSLKRARLSMQASGFVYNVDDHGHIELPKPDVEARQWMNAPAGPMPAERKRRSPVYRIPRDPHRARTIWDAMQIHGMDTEYERLHYTKVRELAGYTDEHTQAVNACLTKMSSDRFLVHEKRDGFYQINAALEGKTYEEAAEHLGVKIPHYVYNEQQEANANGDG